MPIAQTFEEIEDASGIVGIEIARGLISEQEGWFDRESTSDCHPLLLSATELPGKGVGARLDIHFTEQRCRALSPLRRGNPGELHRQFDIFCRGQGRQKMEELKNGPQPGAPQFRDLILIRRSEVSAFEDEFTGVEGFNRSEAVEERRFSRPGRTHECDAFAGMNG